MFFNCKGCHALLSAETAAHEATCPRKCKTCHVYFSVEAYATHEALCRPRCRTCGVYDETHVCPNKPGDYCYFGGIGK